MKITIRETKLSDNSHVYDVLLSTDPNAPDFALFALSRLDANALAEKLKDCIDKHTVEVADIAMKTGSL